MHKYKEIIMIWMLLSVTGVIIIFYNRVNNKKCTDQIIKTDNDLLIDNCISIYYAYNKTQNIKIDKYYAIYVKVDSMYIFKHRQLQKKYNVKTYVDVIIDLDGELYTMTYADFIKKIRGVK